HTRPAPGRFSRHRVPHLAARSIADVAHRVDVLVGGTGCDDDEPAEKRSARLYQKMRRLDDLIRLREPPLADPSAREVPLAWIDEADTACAQRREVPAHRLV